MLRYPLRALALQAVLQLGGLLMGFLIGCAVLPFMIAALREGLGPALGVFKSQEGTLQLLSTDMFHDVSWSWRVALATLSGCIGIGAGVFCGVVLGRLGKWLIVERLKLMTQEQFEEMQRRVSEN